MKLRSVGFAGLVVGVAIAIVGLGAYQAWWTIAFAIGGLAIALADPHETAPLRLILIGVSICGALLLAGMSLFFLYAAVHGPARPCDECSDPVPGFLAAVIGSVVGTVLLLLLTRRLLRKPNSNDTQEPGRS